MAYAWDPLYAILTNVTAAKGLISQALMVLAVSKVLVAMPDMITSTI